MAELFSGPWMERFVEEWNGEPSLYEALEKIGFSSVIGYGFAGEDRPAGVLKVEKGRAVAGGPHQDEALNWDIRASREQWEKWMQKPPGMSGLGLAVTTGKMKFKVGDYAAMLKDPRMAGPFIKSFTVMARV
ncbi:MAG: SCP-2 sterol transfer family protein [Gammaproteobacteria bacterium]